MCESQLNEDITMDIMIVLFLFFVFIFNNILTVILLNVVINMVPSTCTASTLHIASAHRMLCQSLTVAITLLSRRCYVCHPVTALHAIIFSTSRSRMRLAGYKLCATLI